MGQTRNGYSYGKLDRNRVYHNARDTIACELGYRSIAELEGLAMDSQEAEMHLLTVNEMAVKEVAKYGPSQLYGSIVENGGVA